jgi:hypothetical protein
MAQYYCMNCGKLIQVTKSTTLCMDCQRDVRQEKANSGPSMGAEKRWYAQSEVQTMNEELTPERIAALTKEKPAEVKAYAKLLKDCLPLIPKISNQEELSGGDDAKFWELRQILRDLTGAEAKEQAAELAELAEKAAKKAGEELKNGIIGAVVGGPLFGMMVGGFYSMKTNSLSEIKNAAFLSGGALALFFLRKPLMKLFK